MGLSTLMTRTVTISHPGIHVDAYGDTQRDWTTATEVDTVGWLAYSSSIENLDGRDATSTMLSLTMPAGTAIGARDRVRIDGRTYEVDGEPTSAWAPRGEHHIECRLVVWDG